MQRRNFIRLVGGGTLAASLVPLTACSSAPPARSIEAWNGPAGDVDLPRWALSFALLAPNAHNRQPWLVDVREPGAIKLYVDRERLLPETDPYHRQIMISQGTFVELLVMALQARGQRATVHYFPEGEPGPRTLDDRPVALVRWEPVAGAAALDPLFAQVLRRHTAKVDYDTARPVPDSVLQALVRTPASTDPYGLQTGGVVEGDALVGLRQLAMEAALVEVRTERTVMESQRLMRIGPDEIAAHRDGISVNTPLVRLLNKTGLFDREAVPTEGSQAMKTLVSRYAGHTATAMGFVWLTSDTASNAVSGRTRAAEVAAGRRYVRMQLQATALGLKMHPMSQALQEFDEMRSIYARVHQMLVGVPATTRTVQMLCRIGFAEDQPPSPRRALDGIIRT